MFELHELSPDKDELAEKIDKIITNIKENQTGNHGENVISDDDVTIVLSQTDDDKSISEEDSSKKKRSISITSDRSHKSSHTSPTSNKSKTKSKRKSRRGFNLKKKFSEESENVLQVKSVVDENQNGSPGEAKTPSEQEVEKVKLPNDFEVKVVRRGRKVIAPNINSITTRSPRKQSTSESLSLPDVYKSVASSFSSSAMEKPDEKSTVKTRGRRAAATPHSSQKNNEHQLESDGEKEEQELKGSAKFKKFKNMTDRMASAFVLVQRLSPLIVSQTRVANQKSSSEEKGASEKSAVADSTPKLVEEEIPEVELILSMDEVDDSESEALSSRKREIESVSEGSEEKRRRVEEDATLIVVATPDVTVLIEDNSPTDVVNLQITEEKLVATPRRRRGRPRKSITPESTNQIALKEDDVTVVVDPESKKNFPAKSKPKLHSESSDELAEDFKEEAAEVSERQPSANENEASKQDTQSVDQKGSPIEDTPSKLTLKRSRGRPSKVASRSVLTNILTRRNSNTSSVTPPKKNRLSDEISIISVVESCGDVENSDKGNVTNHVQKKGVKSGARRGRGRPAKTSISPKTTIEKSPVIVATHLTRKTTPLERRMKYCYVLLERDPEVEAFRIAMINSKGKRKKVASSQVEIPVAARVTRGMQKLASKSEPDSKKIAPLSPRRKRFRQI